MKKPHLNNKCVAISISSSPDMAVRGLGDEHLEDAMSEIARHLIAGGATLAYGGDLRPGGFTELLFEIVARHKTAQDREKVLVRNYLAWPVHARMARTDIEDLQSGLEGLASIILLSLDGKEIRLDERPREAFTIADTDWPLGLTAMREAVSSRAFARVAVGGQVANYRGKLPGIAEEALIQLQHRKPLYLMGGFGGCSADLVRSMNLSSSVLRGSAGWPGIEKFETFGPTDMCNGLTEEENRRLSETVHVDEAATLILRGLFGKARKAP